MFRRAKYLFILAGLSLLLVNHPGLPSLAQAADAKNASKSQDFYEEVVETEEVVDGEPTAAAAPAHAATPVPSSSAPKTKANASVAKPAAAPEPEPELDLDKALDEATSSVPATKPIEAKPAERDLTAPAPSGVSKETSAKESVSAENENYETGAGGKSINEEEFLEEEAGISKEERVSPDVQAPKGTALETAMKAEEEAGTSDTVPEAGAAKEMLKMPSILTNLEDCKKVALLNDPRAQVALKQIRWDRNKVREAERVFLPAVKGTWERQDGSAALSGGAPASGGNDTAFNSLKYAIEGEQVLFQGGKLVYTLKQAKNNFEIAKKKYYQARQEIINKVEKAYYTLVRSQMTFEIQADLSKAAESALSFSREAYKRSLNPYHEFLNVQSQTDQTYYQLLSYQQEITMAELGLRQACKLPSSVAIQIDAVLTFSDFNFNYSLDECLGLAFKNRPDLAVSEFSALSDVYGVKIAMADGLPKISLLGTIGKNGQVQANQPFTLGDEWSLKLDATWPLGANSAKYSLEKKKSVPVTIGASNNITASLTHHAEVALFDKMEIFSNIAKLQTQAATTVADLSDLREKVANEVEENYFNYQKAMTMVTASLSKIKFREKDLEVNRAKQKMDELPLSQVLTSELQLGEERVNYVKALSDYYIAISGLFKAMGLAK